MKILRFAAICGVVLALTHSSLAAAPGRGNTTPTFTPQTRPDWQPRATDSRLRQVITRIRTDADLLRQTVDATATTGRGGYRTGQDDLLYLSDDLVESANHLDDHIVRRQATRYDVEDVLRRAAAIQSQIDQRSYSTRAQNAWARLKSDVDSLANEYGMQWNWNSSEYPYPPYPSGTTYATYEKLSGTFELDSARSQDPRRALDQATSQLSSAERNRVSTAMQSRLNPPEVLVLERTQNRVTIESSRAPQMSFDVDGRPHTETTPNGRNITTRSTLYGDRLEVTANGLAGSDFAVSFEPLDNGQSLRVTRRLYSDSLRQPVVLESVYRRTSTTPDWNVYQTRPDPVRNDRTYPPTTAAVVPDGTVLTASLDNAINAGSARQGDRITLTVHNAQRAELQGAVIEGYLASAPNRSGGRTSVQIDFDRIRLRNGRTGDFDGVVTGIRGPNGEDIEFNDDPNTNPNQQRDQAVQRGAIGAAVGAIIGALAGGGKGAAIGAILGGGGGAATVFIDPKGSNDLPRGTEFTIRSRVPAHQ